MSATTFLLILINLIHGQWISPPVPTLPFSDNTMCTAHYKDIIFIIGGHDNNNKRQLTEYNITNNSFSSKGNIIPSNSFGAFGTSQYWTQIDNILYILTGWYNQDTYLERFDLISKNYTSRWMTVPIYRESRSCLASTNDHLFIIGGLDYVGGIPGLKTMDILDLRNNSWSIGPEMNEGRRAFACIVSPINNKLYAIGGHTVHESTAFYLSTVEYISTTNIHQNSWQYTINNMSLGLWLLRSVIYGTKIYTIGGNDGNDNAQNVVHIIDTNTDIISISPNSLAFGIYSTTPIIIDNTIYSFGGAIANPPFTTSDRFQYTIMLST